MFPFENRENAAAITCTHVLKKGQPILYAYHDEDDDWQFLCGAEHGEADAMVVSLKEMYEHDPSIADLATLPMGMYAERTSKEEAWKQDS
ncbi:MAG: hypothetical protein LBT26_09500 [Clostridiales Family XIII bacterium]|jgi:hypothetical protein|nr:hypothetical protein [Clostridiales Family XIII bacterium]